MLVSLQVSDYSIDCNSSKHSTYRAVSYILIVMFSMTVPIALFIQLYRSRQAQQAEVNTTKMGFVSRRMMVELNLDNLTEIQDAIIDLKQGREFGSLINAYRPGEVAKRLADQSSRAFFFQSENTMSCLSRVHSSY